MHTSLKYMCACMPTYMYIYIYIYVCVLTFGRVGGWRWMDGCMSVCILSTSLCSD